MMHIATATDGNYIQHAGVMLCSLLENNPKQSFQIHLFCENVSDKHLSAIQQLTNRYNCHLHIYPMDLEKTQFPISGHITLASYFKIFIPERVPLTVQRLLYLDTDIVVNQEINELWNTNLAEPHTLAAVEEIVNQRTVDLGIPMFAKYFNAGVLLIDLQKWRSQQVTKKAVDFLSRYPERIEFHDQDVLNGVLHGCWKPLHPRYNMQGPLFAGDNKPLSGDALQLKEAAANPTIIHYSAASKPWHYLCNHPYTEQYYKYLKQTPWKDYSPQGKTAPNIVRKTIRPYLKKIGITKVLGRHLY